MPVDAGQVSQASAQIAAAASVLEAAATAMGASHDPAVKAASSIMIAGFNQLGSGLADLSQVVLDMANELHTSQG